jgi:hypothetical protein
LHCATAATAQSQLEAPCFVHVTSSIIGLCNIAASMLHDQPSQLPGMHQILTWIAQNNVRPIEQQ